MELNDLPEPTRLGRMATSTHGIDLASAASSTVPNAASAIDWDKMDQPARNLLGSRKVP